MSSLEQGRRHATRQGEAINEVLTTETLSRLYGTNVDVLRVRGRVVVVGVPDEPDSALGETGHAHAHDEEDRMEDIRR